MHNCISSWSNLAYISLAFCCWTSRTINNVQITSGAPGVLYMYIKVVTTVHAADLTTFALLAQACPMSCGDLSEWLTLWCLLRFVLVLLIEWLQNGNRLHKTSKNIHGSWANLCFSKAYRFSMPFYVLAYHQDVTRVAASKFYFLYTTLQWTPN